MLDERKRRRGRRRELSHRDNGAPKQTDVCFRSRTGTGVEKVSGPGVGLPGESGQPGRN